MRLTIGTSDDYQLRHVTYSSQTIWDRLQMETKLRVKNATATAKSFIKNEMKAISDAGGLMRVGLWYCSAIWKLKSRGMQRCREGDQIYSLL